jgi:hypothetical protein
MMQLAARFPEIEIVSPLATQLSWSHIVELLPLESDDAFLYTKASRGQIELLELDKAGIAVSEYWTALFPQKTCLRRRCDRLSQKHRNALSGTKHCHQAVCKSKSIISTSPRTTQMNNVKKSLLVKMFV